VEHLKRPRLLVLRVVGLACVVFLQWQLGAMHRVDARSFDRFAFELERSQAWRYGYVLQYHGAVLVKTRLTPGAPPLRPPRPDDRLAVAMMLELRGASVRAVAELVFYAALWALARFGLSRISWPRTRSVTSPWPALARAAIAMAAFVTAAMTPYLLAGYGEPLFSNHMGPGAMSSTGLVPTTGAVVSAVSYGMLLEALLMWPMIAGTWAAEPLSAHVGVRISLWLVACGFWSVGVALIGLASSRQGGGRRSTRQLYTVD
jgi:hypothetical protein